MFVEQNSKSRTGRGHKREKRETKHRGSESVYVCVCVWVRGRMREMRAKEKSEDEADVSKCKWVIYREKQRRDWNGNKDCIRQVLQHKKRRRLGRLLTKILIRARNLKPKLNNFLLRNKKYVSQKLSSMYV